MTQQNDNVDSIFSLDMDWHTIPYFVRLSEKKESYKNYLNENPLQFSFIERLGEDTRSFYCYLFETTSDKFYDLGAWYGEKEEVLALAKSGAFVERGTSCSLQYLEWQFKRYIHNMEEAIYKKDSSVAKIIVFRSDNDDNVSRLEDAVQSLLSKPFHYILRFSDQAMYEVMISEFNEDLKVLTHCDSHSHVLSVLRSLRRPLEQKISLVVDGPEMLELVSFLAKEGIVIEYIFMDAFQITVDEADASLCEFPHSFWELDDYIFL